eukprot:scaffold98367_cov42-Prasinocladus_malaysianus.AAC.1
MGGDRRAEILRIHHQSIAGPLCLKGFEAAGLVARHDQQHEDDKAGSPQLDSDHRRVDLNAKDKDSCEKESELLVPPGVFGSKCASYAACWPLSVYGSPEEPIYGLNMPPKDSPQLVDPQAPQEDPELGEEDCPPSHGCFARSSPVQTDRDGYCHPSDAFVNAPRR